MKQKIIFVKSVFLFVVLLNFLSFAQTITVTSPNGGEVWLPGSTHDIEWDQLGLTADGATNIKIDYSLDNGTTWVNIDTIAHVTAASRSYSWTLPNVDVATALVQLTEIGGSGVSDQSDAVFSIHQPKLGIPTLTTPTDGDSLINTKPTLQWARNLDPTNIFDDEDKYEIKIATDQWFANVVYTNTDVTSGGATTSLTLTSADSLHSNSKYYWKIRAKYTSVTPTVYSPWSSTYVFTTTPAVVKPIQTFPISVSGAGTTIVYTNTPTFYWYTGVVSSHQHFEVWYGVDGTVTPPTNGAAVGSTYGGGILVSHALIKDTLHYTIPSILALTSNTTYNWWVRATDGINTSNWSAKGVFKTSSTNGGAVVPIGTYPTQGEYQYTIHPTLHWYVLTQVTGLEFNVQLSLDSTFTSGVYTYWTDTTNFYFQIPTALLSDTVYYWRVNSTADNNGSYSAWSPRYSFRTSKSSGQPPKPTLAFPSDGESVYYSYVTLNWYVETVATNLRYELYYSTSGTNPTSSTTPTIDGIVGTDTTISGLTANTTYYWWVRSADSTGSNESEWSDRGSFVTTESAAQVKVPTQLYPTGGITVTGTDVNLSWAYFGDTTGVQYEVRYSLYPDMTLATTLDTTVIEDSLHYNLSGLTTGTTYYWEVRATNGTLTSAWAGPEQFSTWASSEAPLVVPIAGSPVANVIVETKSPVLSWFLPTGSKNLSYELQYSLNGDFSNATEVSGIKTNSYVIENVAKGTKYYWRVRSIDDNGNTSIYSSATSFAVEGVTGVEKENIIPDKFEVSQNYPNPFNPSTVIKYSLPKAEYVTIRIYNMLGQEVATLLNERVDAGVYNVTWNGTNNSGAKVATGSYIYRVTAGENVVTKKMILLK